MSQDSHDIVDQQIQNERAARSKAADAIGAIFDWAFAAAKAFPENVGAIAWQLGGNLILRYDEHDAVLVLGVPRCIRSTPSVRIVTSRPSSADRWTSSSARRWKVFRCHQRSRRRCSELNVRSPAWYHG